MGGSSVRRRAVGRPENLPSGRHKPGLDGIFSGTAVRDDFSFSAIGSQLQSLLRVERGVAVGVVAVPRSPSDRRGGRRGTR